MRHPLFQGPGVGIQPTRRIMASGLNTRGNRNNSNNYSNNSNNSNSSNTRNNRNNRFYRNNSNSSKNSDDSNNGGSTLRPQKRFVLGISKVPIRFRYLESTWHFLNVGLLSTKEQT